MQLNEQNNYIQTIRFTRRKKQTKYERTKKMEMFYTFRNRKFSTETVIANDE